MSLTMHHRAASHRWMLTLPQLGRRHLHALLAPRELNAVAVCGCGVAFVTRADEALTHPFAWFRLRRWLPSHRRAWRYSREHGPDWSAHSSGGQR